MGEQLSNSSILDQFICIHEQSYEEFLNTFTYVLKEKEGKTIQESKVDSLRKTFSASEISNRTKQDGSPGRSKEMWVSLPPQMPEENATAMNESWKAGGSDGNDLRLSERVKLLGDDVQPFSLDEEFDYDNVALTPKFSEAELKAIMESSEEKKTGTDVNSA